MLRCKSKLCILRLKFGGNAPAICTFTPVKVPPKWDLKLLVKRPVFCSLHCLYISMPIAKYVCQQSEKAQQEPVPRVSLANQTGENMAASIRIRQRHLSEMKGGKHSRMTVELTRLYFHYLSSTSFKLKWLETTFCPYKDRRCINLSVSLLWVFCHCLVPSYACLLLWQAICAAVLFCKSGAKGGSVWGARVNYAWVSAPWRTHNKASRDGARHRAQTNQTRFMLIQGLP